LIVNTTLHSKSTDAETDVYWKPSCTPAGTTGIYSDTLKIAVKPATSNKTPPSREVLSGDTSDEERFWISSPAQPVQGPGFPRPGTGAIDLMTEQPNLIKQTQKF